MTLSSRAVAALVAETTSEVFLVLIKFEHPNLSIPIRIANNNESIFRTENSQLVEYFGIPFEIELPSDTGESLGVATIGIQNVDKMIVETLRAISTPPTVSLYVVIAETPDVIEQQFTGLSLTNATYDIAMVRGTLTFEDLLTEPISFVITPDRFPGVF